MTHRYGPIIIYAIPVILMIGIIPLVQNDYLLAALYIVCTLVLMSVRRERGDWAALLFGLIAMTASEYFFVRTGVETFLRHSFLGVMPLWLPFLWMYAFVTIKRSLRFVLE